jgi:hypothetical protein
MTWTAERKAKQSQLIRQWQPWSKSTGAKTPYGKAVVSRNAFKGGLRPYMRQVARDLAEEIKYTQQLIDLSLPLQVSSK